MIVMAIDPDPNGGTYCALRPGGEIVAKQRQVAIDTVTYMIGRAVWKNTEPTSVVAVEIMQGMGMAVGKEVFESCYRIGEIMAACKEAGVECWPVTRVQVKSTVCGSARAKDANVRAALLELYPPSGGGKVPQVGTKSQPGPLYGFGKDDWSALAIGLCYLYSRETGPLWERDTL